MKKQIKWEVRVTLEKDRCPFKHNGKCSLLKYEDNRCAYENCPRKLPITCKDCRYLYFNQNPKEPLTTELTSSCGIKNFKDIFTASELQKEHYKRPGWCPAKYDVSNKEVLELVKD